MTELQLYKFITDNHIETNQTDSGIIAFIDFSGLDEFVSLLDHSLFDDGRYSCILQHGNIAVTLDGICEYYGIDIDNVFKTHTHA